MHEAQDAFGSGNRVALRNVLRGTHPGGDFEGIASAARDVSARDVSGQGCRRPRMSGAALIVWA